jgi:hypothetical protein
MHKDEGNKVPTNAMCSFFFKIKRKNVISLLAFDWLWNTICEIQQNGKTDLENHLRYPHANFHEEKKTTKPLSRYLRLRTHGYTRVRLIVVSFRLTTLKNKHQALVV